MRFNMPTEKTIALPPTTKKHQEPHKPLRGRVISTGIYHNTGSVKVVELGEHGIFEVTYWNPEQLECRADGMGYNLDRALATWKKVKDGA